MWKLLYKLFGFEYAYIKNSAGGGYRRVCLSPSGKWIIVAHGHGIDTISLENGGFIGDVFVCDGWRVTPLTPEVSHFIETIRNKNDK